jgi:hypothetical protein
MSKSKSKDLDSGLAPEKLPTPPGPPRSALAELVPALELGTPPATTRPGPGALAVFEATELLLHLEEKCVHGGTVGLDEVRAVLAKLREGA